MWAEGGGGSSLLGRNRKPEPVPNHNWCDDYEQPFPLQCGDEVSRRTAHSRNTGVCINRNKVQQ